VVSDLIESELGSVLLWAYHIGKYKHKLDEGSIVFEMSAPFLQQTYHNPVCPLCLSTVELLPLLRCRIAAFSEVSLEAVHMRQAAVCKSSLSKLQTSQSQEPLIDSIKRYACTIKGVKEEDNAQG